MAKTETGPETEAREREEPPVNGRTGLAKLAEFTRRILAVPKDEMRPAFVKPKKPAKRKRR